MEKIKREYQHYYIYVSWKNGQTVKQIHQELRVAEGSNALSEHTIYWWIEAFKDGDEGIEDDPAQDILAKLSPHERLQKWRNW